MCQNRKQDRQKRNGGGGQNRPKGTKTGIEAPKQSMGSQKQALGPKNFIDGARTGVFVFFFLLIFMEFLFQRPYSTWPLRAKANHGATTGRTVSFLSPVAAMCYTVFKKNPDLFSFLFSLLFTLLFCHTSFLPPPLSLFCYAPVIAYTLRQLIFRVVIKMFVNFTS